MSHHYQPPCTPPRPTRASVTPYTPNTPNDDLHKRPHHEFKEKHLKVPTVTPRKLVAASSMITPDLTPKIKKRNDMFEQLMAESTSKTTFSTSKTSRKVSSLRESCYEKDSIADSSDEENCSHGEEPGTPKDNSYDWELLKTPASKVLKTRVTLNDEFEESNTLSSPSINKKEKANIFNLKGKALIFPNLAQKDRIDFNPHKEILLINKKGDSIIKRFDTKNKFDREFKPKCLLNEFLTIEKGKDKHLTNEELEARDDAFIKKLLSEEDDYDEVKEVENLPLNQEIQPQLLTMDMSFYEK